VGSRLNATDLVALAVCCLDRSLQPPCELSCAERGSGVLEIGGYGQHFCWITLGEPGKFMLQVRAIGIDSAELFEHQAVSWSGLRSFMEITKEGVAAKGEHGNLRSRQQIERSGEIDSGGDWLFGHYYQ
jgi:hypothetical protein